MLMRTSIFIGVYLAAIVIANTLLAVYGPQYLVFGFLPLVILGGFVFIGLDITVRDYLHEQWKNNLVRNMFLLIGAGSILSALFNIQAWYVAVASFTAFAVAGLGDSITYTYVSKYARFVKINGSNIVSAALDSFVFLTLISVLSGMVGPATALPLSLVPALAVGQILAKVAGGFVWERVITTLFYRRAEAIDN